MYNFAILGQNISFSQGGWCIVVVALNMNLDHWRTLLKFIWKLINSWTLNFYSKCKLWFFKLTKQFDPLIKFLYIKQKPTWRVKRYYLLLKFKFLPSLARQKSSVEKRKKSMTRINNVIIRGLSLSHQHNAINKQHSINHINNWSLSESSFASCLVPRYCVQSKLLWGKEAQLSMYIDCKLILCNHALICIKLIVVEKRKQILYILLQHSSIPKLQIQRYYVCHMNKRCTKNSNGSHSMIFLW